MNLNDELMKIAMDQKYFMGKILGAAEEALGHHAAGELSLARKKGRLAVSYGKKWPSSLKPGDGMSGAAERLMTDGAAGAQDYISAFPNAVKIFQK